ncbi:SDR family NAD(P)-dependent oxidoreductase [Actinoplanes sp. CA-142083]|uniref:SDR family NAD(P)-dependent oxidoreductase n=1 Tax=Actinoplanes sp. CA-142083 TaxID=3239903 RepID=UPI003D8A4F4C
MVVRNSGSVLFTSSVASMMPGTYQAVYNASKSFVQSLGAMRADVTSPRPPGRLPVIGWSAAPSARRSGRPGSRPVP